MQVNIQNVIIIISLTKLQGVYIKCTFVMLFLFSNTDYGFIGVHWGFTPTPGIILNTHTQWYAVTMEFIAQHQITRRSLRSRIMYNTVTHTLILKLYPTPPSGEG